MAGFTNRYAGRRLADMLGNEWLDVETMGNSIGDRQMITEKEYRAAPGINYSLIADYASSPDRALMGHEPKSYFDFGNIFEIRLQDKITGENLFQDKYFVADLKGNIPDKLCKWLEDDTDLQECYTYNKDGKTRSGKCKNIHAWLDACLENPGKHPVSQDVMAQIDLMISNMLKIELFGAKLTDILVPENVQFQVPVFWESGTIKKKALIDIVALVRMQGENINLLFDIKTTANHTQFKRMFRAKYWIQNIHYVEGSTIKLGATYPKMIFLAASKEEPYIAQPYELETGSTAIEILSRYKELCEDVSLWVAQGKPKRGWRPLESIKIFI
jgi:hypothetical protein